MIKLKVGDVITFSGDRENLNNGTFTINSVKETTFPVRHLTLKDLALRWGVTYKTARKMVGDNNIHHFRTSAGKQASMRFMLEDVVEFESRGV